MSKPTRESRRRRTREQRDEAEQRDHGRRSAAGWGRDHPRSRAVRDWIAPLIVAAVTFVAFLPVLRAEFVAWDDPANFLQNTHYRGLGWTELRWMWTTTLLGHYVPLSWMTLGLDYVLWGMNPAGYHATNLVLHCVNAVLLYHVARRLLHVADPARVGGPRAATVAAAIAALLFAVHPLRVESVAWITERRDMVSLAFSLTSVLFFLRANSDRPRFARWYGLSLVAFACALLSKATAVTLPAALVVLTVYPLRRLGGAQGWRGESARRAYRELAPFFALAVVVGLLSVRALNPGQQFALSGKLAVSAYSLAFYLWKTVAPVRLAPLYERPLAIDPTAPIFLASAAAALAALGGAWMLRRRWPAVAAALAAFTLLVFPLLGLVQNGPQIAADRYTYHAGPALALLAAAAVALPVRRAWLAGAGVAAVVALSVLTWRQTAVWRTSETVWRRVLELDSASYLANNNLGVVMAEQGRSADATELYERSLRTRPAYADAHNNLGYELAQQGKIDAAIEHYARALAINPGYADAEVNWGNALFGRGQFDDAIRHYAAAAKLDPERAGTHFNWALALREKGDLAAAIAQFEAALAIDPEMSEAAQARSESVEALRRRHADSSVTPR